MLFDYNLQKQYTKSVDIVDIGQVTLRCSNADLEEYYILIKTSFGKTSILKYGPVLIDSNELLDNFSLSFNEIKYDLKKLDKIIDKFINEPSKKIETIEEITEYEAIKTFPDILKTYRIEDLANGN